jgi:hypothetical protein
VREIKPRPIRESALALTTAVAESGTSRRAGVTRMFRVTWDSVDVLAQKIQEPTRNRN